MRASVRSFVCESIRPSLYACVSEFAYVSACVRASVSKTVRECVYACMSMRTFFYPKRK